MVIVFKFKPECHYGMHVQILSLFPDVLLSKVFQHWYESNFNHAHLQTLSLIRWW